MNFSETVNFYYTSFESTLDVVANLRIEAIVESIKDWSELGDLEEVSKWFLKNQSDCSMSIADIPLFECKGWSYSEDKGVFQHESGEFFFVQGLRVSNTKGREVASGWDQPILTQVGFNGGLLGLLRQKKNGIPYYLVEAKAEPGNPDKVQISPTLQATFSNLKQAHGGNKPRYAEFFEFPLENTGTVLFDQWMSEDGGRLHLKRNKGMLVEIPPDYYMGEIPYGFRWITLFQLKELIKINSWVGPHIRSIISHL
jgi:dTDP-4-dehydro-6-deoxy-alpha-D-glucopyranose 2,3-dehydratase